MRGPGYLKPMSRDEALACVADARVSRIAFPGVGGPDILPVNHVVLDGAIFFRTGAGSKLGAAAAGSRVAVETDDYETDRRSGWSVVVRGPAEIVTDEGQLERLHALDFEPWALPDTRTFWIRIAPEEVTGRRLHGA